MGNITNQTRAGMSVRRRRRWFAPDGDHTPGAEPPAKPEPTEPDRSPSAETTPTDETEHMIPKSRFDEINNRAKVAEAEVAKLRDEMEQRKTADAKAEEERLKKQGEFEQLYTTEQAKAADFETQLKAKSERLAKLEERFTAMLNKRLEAMPDHIKPLIEKMDALEAMDYLTEHADQFAQTETGPRKQTPPPFNGADGVGDPGERKMTLHRRVRL